MTPEVDFRYLKAFQVTALHLNFTKAAEELNIAQSAISRQIKLLEASLGEQLIIRSSKRVLLTDKGKSLLQAVGQFQELADNIIKSQKNQMVKVGILHGLLETWFIKIIKDFVKTTPHELIVEIDTPQNLKKKLIDGQYDLIFTPENIQNDLITSLGLFEEKLIIISKKEIDLKKIHENTWLTYAEYDFFFDLYKKHSNRIIRVASMTSIIRLVKESVGIAIVPAHTVKKDDRLFTYDVKGIKRPKIFMNTLNYQTYPQHIESIIKIIQKNI